MTEQEQKWVDQAKYDLETARAMLDSSRYIYVLFCCQQAIEKALKYLILRKTGDLPPRIHNLIRLAETAKIELNIEQALLCKELSAYYVQTRYPEEIQEIGSVVTHKIAAGYFMKTEEILKWLFSIQK